MKLKIPSWVGTTIGLLSMGMMPALGAEQIKFSYSLLEFSLPVTDLKTYAQEGKISSQLASYTKRLKPEDVAQLRQVLTEKQKLSPVAVSQFLYSEIGESMLNSAGELIQTDSRQNGFYAIRAALILAAADPGGLTLLNTMRYFPSQNIRINTEKLLALMNKLSTLKKETNQALSVIEQQSTTEASTEPPVNISKLPELYNKSGSFSWQKKAIAFVDTNRKSLTGSIKTRVIQTDIYLPESQSSAPVVVISHGLGSDRDSFAYLAENLASYGFAVVVPQHPGSDSLQMEALLTGKSQQVFADTELIDRPLDVTFILDQLEQRSTSDPWLQGKINVQQVGVIGQSFGGYTALVLAGARININQLHKDCKSESDPVNMSLLLQCRALALGKNSPDYEQIQQNLSNLDLGDRRVKAVIALNPVTSSLLGQAGLSRIEIPVTIAGGASDTFTPALLEQVQAFSWLTTKDKYLGIGDKGNHTDLIAGVSTVILPSSNRFSSFSGRDPELGRIHFQAFSTAFMKVYLAHQTEYRPFLSTSYVKNSNRDEAVKVYFVRSLPPGFPQELVRKK
ncbi:MAG: alpha/beta hydrolase [Nostoc sp.]|uniref:alpha/beta hydrolase n=1 Tax=Nostoc sp. TaxID=1180 RepID=UPI002FFC752C